MTQSGSDVTTFGDQVWHQAGRTYREFMINPYSSWNPSDFYQTTRRGSNIRDNGGDEMEISSRLSDFEFDLPSVNSDAESSQMEASTENVERRKSVRHWPTKLHLMRHIKDPSKEPESLREKFHYLSHQNRQKTSSSGAVFTRILNAESSQIEASKGNLERRESGHHWPRKLHLRNIEDPSKELELLREKFHDLFHQNKQRKCTHRRLEAQVKGLFKTR